jgi:tetratricopeptide (TPR) repeat protein
MHTTRPCPDSALLAAFIEGGLSPYERPAVVTHLAECDQCRSVAVGVVGFQEVQSLDLLWERPSRQAAVIPIDLSQRPEWWRRAAAGAGLVATAAVLAALAVPLLKQNSWFERRPLADLVDATRGARTTEARVSGGFEYARRPIGDWRARESTRPWQLVSAAGRIRDTYAENDGAGARQAVGVASLLVGEIDDAVSQLMIASSAAPHEGRIANDLAAAYYERSELAARPDDLPRALSAAERAVALAPHLPEAWFNRALIFSALGLTGDARAAWDAYLAKDPSSHWADEARDRVRALNHERPPTRWETIQQRLDMDTAEVADVAVRAFPGKTRTYVEQQLLAAWADSEPAAKDAALLRASSLSEAFLRLTADRLYVETIAVIQAARSRNDAVALEQLARGHRAYADAMGLLAAGSPPQAAIKLRLAVQHLDTASSPFAFRARIEFAATRYALQDYAAFDEAIKGLGEAMRARRYGSLVARSLWLEGLVAQMRTDFLGAQVRFEQQLEVAQSLGDVEEQANAKVLLANVHWQLGDQPTAWRYRIEAAPVVTQLENSTLAAGLFLNAAADAQLNGQYDAALALQSSLLRLPVTHNVNIELQALAQRARTLYALNREREALQDLQRARVRVSQVPEVMRARYEPDVLLTEAEVLQGSDPTRAIAAAERGIRLAADAPPNQRVARFNLALANLMTARGELVAADRAIRAGVAALEALIDAPRSELQIASADSLWGLYVKGIEIALRQGDVALAFEYSERRRASSSFERRGWGKSVLTLAEVQRRLPENTAVAVLNQLGNQLHVWIISRNAVRAHSTPLTPSDAAGLVASHLNEISRGASAQHYTGRLYDTLLGPVAYAFSGIRNIAIIPDAPYHRVAFAGLWDRGSDRYLIENHTVVAAPSATAFAWAVARGDAMRAEGGRAAVFLEAPNSELPAVMAGENRGERDRGPLASFYPGAERRLGLAATPARLLRDVTERNIVHVAAPTIGNDAFPFLSRLLLADAPAQRYSGNMFAGRVASHEMARARLVALETDFGPDSTHHGDGVLAFVRALLAAGVPNVVGSAAHTKAGNLAAAWRDFHRYYASGLPAAESLRLAQLTAVGESNRRLGPWAMLTVFGSTQ